MSLDEALKVVKLAGYRVTKPKPKKQTKVGPTCVVMYADGFTARMTTATTDEKPDFARGLSLCAAAWESKHCTDNRLPAYMLACKITDRYRNALMNAERLDNAVARVVAKTFPPYVAPTLPAIQRAWFERNGDVIAVMQGDQLQAA